MRDTACQEWVSLAQRKPFAFLTGDLGFGALEPLREALDEYFINAGVAEQNMISVAAGLALSGIDSWVYSIAPFCYARPFEQIRNDVCQHRLPVKLVGNGGGYGYGPMGPSHHALDDYGSLLTLPAVRAYIPAFAADLNTLIPKLAGVDHPSYLRLGRCELPTNTRAPNYKPWRKLLPGDGPLVLTIGPLAGAFWSRMQGIDEAKRPELWALSELPLEDIPNEFLCGVQERGVCVVEEHVAQGGGGQQLAHYLIKFGKAPKYFLHMHALGYPSGNYGSQAFHRKECGLDPDEVLSQLSQLDRIK